ncbi:MAG: DUF4286 family protein [Chloroflexota bacterium]
MPASEWLLIVDVEVEPEVENEWNRWYDQVHLPEILGCPGFVQGARYAYETGESVRRYVTIYDITGPDAVAGDEFTSRRGWDGFSDSVRFTSRLYKRRTVQESKS